MPKAKQVVEVCSPAVAWEERFRSAVVGQEECLTPIIESVQAAKLGIAEPGRPIATSLLLGPTGTGKTKTVEALAAAIHGSEKNVLKIDCGEFQMEHEVAKLIGSPPGYLGHRETQAMLNQNQLRAVTSSQCNLSIVLFDEIEKGAPSLTNLLLGIMDKATLRLGDNTAVNFEESLIFLTSNLGAKQITDRPLGYGHPEQASLNSDIRRRCMSAVKTRFSPEFLNRIDDYLCYKPLTQEDMETILDIELDRIVSRHSYHVHLTDAARARILSDASSMRWGARELRRILNRRIVKALPRFIASWQDLVGAEFILDDDLCLAPAGKRRAA